MNEPIGEKEKLTILLQEYSSLRQEIINRMNNGFQLLAVIAVLLTLTLQGGSRLKVWVGLSAIGIVFLIGGWMTFGNINKAASRLRELERDINARAGEKLLIWESEHGGARTGLWRWIGLPPRFKTPIVDNKVDLPIESAMDEHTKEGKETPK